MGLPDSVHAVVRSTFGAPPSQSGNHRSFTAPTSPTAASTPTAIANSSTQSQTGLTTSSGTATAASSLVPAPDSSTAESNTSGLFVGNLKFTESRLFLFEQMLVVTEEVKLKRRATSSDTFSQSTYQFRAAINVNKMRYEVSKHFLRRTPTKLVERTIIGACVLTSQTRL
ncbi:unnamed protein product [Echinostoma caproni]|uniref:SOS1/NGEF-like PH domain-containing protein n=1 Tax=Echinostoma caproni TaxID=27848 RepID=A0A183B234_9TREM|nr:unnamed protein product [Echinostoma caproni]